MVVICEVLHEFEVVTAPASGAEEPVEIRCIHCGRAWPVGGPLPRLYDWDAEGVYGDTPPTSIFEIPDPEDAAAERADEAERAAMVAEERPRGGSNCCGAPMRVESSDEGTSYGVCTACGKPADGQAGPDEAG